MDCSGFPQVTPLKGLWRLDGLIKLNFAFTKRTASVKEYLSKISIFGCVTRLFAKHMSCTNISMMQITNDLFSLAVVKITKRISFISV